MKGSARKQEYRYVAVEIDAVISAVRGMQIAEGGCGVGSAAGDSSRAGGNGCTDSRCPGGRDTADMGVSTEQHSEQAGFKQHREHSTREEDVRCALGQWWW